MVLVILLEDSMKSVFSNFVMHIREIRKTTHITAFLSLYNTKSYVLWVVFVTRGTFSNSVELYRTKKKYYEMDYCCKTSAQIVRPSRKTE
jgi:hypothetical protein